MHPTDSSFQRRYRRLEVPRSRPKSSFKGPRPLFHLLIGSLLSRQPSYHRPSPPRYREVGVTDVQGVVDSTRLFTHSIHHRVSSRVLVWFLLGPQHPVMPVVLLHRLLVDLLYLISDRFHCVYGGSIFPLRSIRTITRPLLLRPSSIVPHLSTTQCTGLTKY